MLLEISTHYPIDLLLGKLSYLDLVPEAMDAEHIQLFGNIHLTFCGKIKKQTNSLSGIQTYNYHIFNQ